MQDFVWDNSTNDAHCTHISSWIPFEYLLWWWEFCHNQPNRTIKAKRKWALHFVFAYIYVYDLNIMSTSQDYSAETGKNMEILLPKWFPLTNISNEMEITLSVFFFSRAVRYGTVTISISLNSAIGTTHQRCSLFYNKNSQLIYGWLESIETLWKALLVPRKCTLTMQFSFEIACSIEKSNTSCCRHFSRRKSPVIHCWRLNLWFLIRFILV